MELVVLAAVEVVLPVLALLLEHMGNVRLSERHHRHHDTYVVPVSFARGLVLAMAFMSVLGFVLGWLCAMLEFLPSPLPVFAFFDAFIVTCFAGWAILNRYKVSVFGSRLVITPFVGHDASVRFDDIDLLRWVGLRKGSGYRDLVIWARGRRVGRISGMVDVEQILMAMDRFDALPRVEGGIIS
ncbi:hypothetical protein [Olsenella sp. An293]|uniref:hypothetical protein n=1 Tax=Olsenella sp. An293 TaxID=1965626 RepID=UPI000B371315|nr:hypothetical protein [Olsenella sp. An293]OUO33058.1 hypothetical protein B5F85_03155 [Olsenella sp. An293]